MPQNWAGWLRRAVRILEALLRPAQTKATEEPPAPADEQPPPAEQAALAPPQLAESPPLRLWQRFIRAERDHLRWLWSHPYVVAIALGLVVVLVVAETWLIQAWDWLVTQLSLAWPNLRSHPVASIGVSLVLLYLLFGLQWLRLADDLVRWVLGGIKKRPRLSALIGGILLLIALWLANNRGTWVVLPFTVGQTETPLQGDQVAIQLIQELNQVGVGDPSPVLVLREPREPRTSSGSITTRQDLPFEECETVLQGPGGFAELAYLTFPRLLAGSQGSSLDLGNLSIGPISIPSQIFTQLIVGILPTSYREFTGQVTEHGGVLEISVASRNSPHAWRVSGPNYAFPEMMEWLALRMALDLNQQLIKSSGLTTAPSDRELAFALGIEAFRQRRYQRARAFFEIADRFIAPPSDEKVHAMLGLTYYHLPEVPVDQALTTMETAVREDPNGDSSLLRPYLVCLYHVAGLEDRAKEEQATLNRYLSRLEFQQKDVRVKALKQLPFRGPGQHLVAAGDDLIFVDDTGTIVGAAGHPLEAQLRLSLADQTPRQIGLYDDSKLLLVSPDGAVLTFDYATGEEAPTPLITGAELNGVQQIGLSTSQFQRTNLFLLDREGNVYWCEPETETGGINACPPQRPLYRKLPAAHQIFPMGDGIYVLATDGAVWHAEINISGRVATPPTQLTAPKQVREIFAAADGSLVTLYLLYDNGTVWRYYDDGRPETDDLKLIDESTDTAQIFAAGGYLYLLKKDGPVWRISNPRNPAPEVDFSRIWAPTEGIGVRELFVTAEGLTNDGASNSRTLYLLTDQRPLLLKGTDTGEPRVTFAPLTLPATAEQTTLP